MTKITEQNARFAAAMAVTAPPVAERIAAAWTRLDGATIDAEAAVARAFEEKQAKSGVTTVFPPFIDLNSRIKSAIATRKPSGAPIALDHVIYLDEAVRSLNQAAVSTPPYDKLGIYDAEQYIDRLFDLQVLK